MVTSLPFSSESNSTESLGRPKPKRKSLKMDVVKGHPDVVLPKKNCLRSPFMSPLDQKILSSSLLVKRVPQLLRATPDFVCIDIYNKAPM